MTTCSLINGRLSYFGLIALCIFTVNTSCSAKHQIRIPPQIENFQLNITERGIEPVDSENLAEQEWWESFYQSLLNIEASDIGHHFQMEHDTELDSLEAFIESRGEQFYSDQFGVVKYLTLGNNSRSTADVSYFRILNARSLSATKVLELLIEKGVEVTWKDMPGKMKADVTLNVGPEDQETPWILYRFKISKLADDQMGTFNRSLTLSCDKYYCVTGSDGTRRVLLAEGKRRYEDLIIPESGGYAILASLFNSAARAYNEYYYW
jgi:hypothetical protein